MATPAQRDGQPQSGDDPLIGSTIGSFLVTRRLGLGGMGTVYLGEQVAIGSKVAIKVLHEHLATNPSLVQRFYAEARATNLIGHEHIVSIIDLSLLPPNRYYFIMEYLEGRALNELARPMLAPQVVHIMAQACDALQAAHTHGVVHRDLKPENMILIRRGRNDEFLKILDFGIAKLFATELAGQKTMAGMIMGTPEFMAPEQTTGEHIDGRTDLYSLGVIAYELVTGRLPFTGANLADLLVAQRIQAAVPPHVVNPRVPVPLSEAIMRAMAKSPEARWQTADDFREALEASLSGEPRAQRPARVAAGTTPASPGLGVHRPPPLAPKPSPPPFSSSSSSSAAVVAGVEPRPRPKTPAAVLPRPQVGSTPQGDAERPGVPQRSSPSRSAERSTPAKARSVQSTDHLELRTWVEERTEESGAPKPGGGTANQETGARRASSRGAPTPPAEPPRYTPRDSPRGYIGAPSAGSSGVRAVFDSPPSRAQSAFSHPLVPRVPATPSAEVPGPTEWSVKVFDQPKGACRVLKCAELTRGGMFILVNEGFPPVLSRFKVSVMLPDGELNLTVEVVQHVTPERSKAWKMPVGFGVQFVELTQAQRDDVLDLAKGQPRGSSGLHRPPEKDDAKAEELLAAYRNRSSASHYEFLDLFEDADFAEVRQRVREEKKGLTALRARLLSARQREQVDALDKKLDEILLTIGQPRHRLTYDAQRGNWKGTARCIAGGVSVTELDNARQRFLAERSRVEGTAHLHFTTGAAWESQKDFLRAQQEFERALSLDPLNLAFHQRYQALRRAMSSPVPPPRRRS